MKLGDAISTVATPIAGALGMDCVDEQGQLKPESFCAKRKAKVNDYSDAVWDFLWPSSKNKQQTENKI